MTTADLCCPHRALDHGRRGTPTAGDHCTVPGCPCRGWVPRAGKGKTPTGLPARIRELRAVGLTNGVIRERLGCSYQQVTRAVRGEA